MEEAKAPKHRLFHWRYDKTFANRVRVDAEWNSDQVRREQSGREPDWPGERFLWDHLYSIDNSIYPSYWTLQKVSTTFTQTT